MINIQISNNCLLDYWTYYLAIYIFLNVLSNISFYKMNRKVIYGSPKILYPYKFSNYSNLSDIESIEYHSSSWRFYNSNL